MHFSEMKNPRPQCRNAFTLIEMLIVIAIMAILMTAGAIGLGGMGAKNVTSAVASSESLFDEARTLAIGKNLRSCVLVSKASKNTPSESLRRIFVATEETNTDGTAKDPTNDAPNWVLSSRGVLLPDQVYFSQVFSQEEDASGTKSALEEITDSKIKSVKTQQQGTYFIYKFNSQGIRIPKGATPGTVVGRASFVVGAGSRNVSDATAKPKAVAGDTRNFGGFIIWRAGNTSMAHAPEQISSSLKTFKAGDQF